MKLIKKVAMIFGVTGQDGSYLSRLLLQKGYQVHGIKRRSSSFNTQRIEDIYKDIHEAKNFVLHYGDLTDGQSINNLISKINPMEIYNLAAQSHVAVSFDLAEYTMMVNALGSLKILEANKRINPKIRFYQASSSEMFGKSKPPQNENTLFNQDLFMQYLKFLLITVLFTIEKLTIYMLVMVYYLITSHLEEE